MPRNEQQNEEVRAESRARIVTSALNVFARHGYERASVRMIAQEAGIAQGLLYNYFAGKEELLRAIFLQGIGGVKESFALAAGGDTPRERLERLLRGSFAILARDRAFWTLLYNVRWQPGIAHSLENDLRAWNELILATLGAIMTDFGVADPAIEATILFALIDGLGQQFVLQPDDFPTDAVIASVLARWTTGD